MIGIVLVSHGTLATGLKQAAEMIVGPQEYVLAIGMEPGEDPAHLHQQVKKAVTAPGHPATTLILTDILGGSPANVSAHLALDGVQVICGVNLPMLLELLTQREHATSEELARLAIEAAREGIIHLP